MRRAAVGVVPILLVLLGCGSEPSTTSVPDPAPSPTRATTSTPTPTPSPSPRPGTTIITADSEYGAMLYDGSGQPIYLFTAEPGSEPACYDACAEDWPPVLTDGEPRGRAGADAALIGTTARSDGRVQVTYAGHPLYYYAHEGAYEVLCHDVEEYGGTWLVVRPDGTAAPA